jgi:hypothetical protein
VADAIPAVGPGYQVHREREALASTVRSTRNRAVFTTVRRGDRANAASRVSWIVVRQRCAAGFATSTSHVAVVPRSARVARRLAHVEQRLADLVAQGVRVKDA